MQAMLWSQDKAIVESNKIHLDSKEATVALETMNRISENVK